MKEHFKIAPAAKRLQTPYNVVVPENNRIAKIIREPTVETVKKNSKNDRIKRNSLNTIDYDIDFFQNSKLNIYDIFDCKPQADGIYWELKAG